MGGGGSRLKNYCFVNWKKGGIKNVIGIWFLKNYCKMNGEGVGIVWRDAIFTYTARTVPPPPPTSTRWRRERRDPPDVAQLRHVPRSLAGWRPPAQPDAPWWPWRPWCRPRQRPRRRRWRHKWWPRCPIPAKVSINILYCYELDVMLYALRL